MLKGIIFDMDGVLVDSEQFICEAGIRMFAEHGITVLPQDFIPFVGAGENRYLGGVAEKHGFPIDIERDKARTYALYAEIVKGKLDPLPGVRDFITKARARGLMLALASSADKVKILINLEQIGLPLETFDAIVSGLDVVKKKPDPEIFLVAAQMLKLSPAECLIIEDAVNGVAAAKAAGARCLGLTTSFAPDELGAADWIANTLADAPNRIWRW